VLGVITVFLVYVLTLRLWDRRVALTAAAIAAVFPPLALLNASLLSESLFLPRLLGVVWVVLRWRESAQARWLVAAGVLCGLAALARSVGSLLVLAAALGVWSARPRFSRRALAAPALVAVVALLTVMPWLVRNAIEFGRPVPLTTQGGYGLAGTYNRESRDRPERPGFGVPSEQLHVFRDVFSRRDLDEAERSNILARRALRYAFDHPGYVVQTWFWNTARVLELAHDVSAESAFRGVFLMGLDVDPVVGPWVFAGLYLVLVLALVGIVVQLGLLPGRRAPAFVWAFPLLMLVPGIAVYGIARYRVPADPFLVMLAAVGVVALVDRLRARPRGAVVAS
jgi:4-amino-4-deoxy-L-arabinose transferase-like glycosyltransferase